MKQRFITGGALLVAVISAVWQLPEGLFSLLVAAVLAIAAWEWMPLAGYPHTAQRMVGAVVTLSVLTVLAWGPWGQTLAPAILAAGAVWWSLALVLVVTWPRSQSLWEPRWVRLIAGGAVLLPSGVALVTLRQSTDGQLLVLVLLAVVMLVDTGGYLIGRASRRPRPLAPAVSPGKTWTGFVGGVGTAAMAPLAISTQCGKALACSPPSLFAASIVAILAAVVGDLLESVAKRHVGVKDSGRLLPGHGGLLDRIDGLLAAAPLFALIWLWGH